VAAVNGEPEQTTTGTCVSRGTVASWCERLGYLPANVVSILVEHDQVTVDHLGAAGRWLCTVHPVRP
jgi:hypothetical protein